MDGAAATGSYLKACNGGNVASCKDLGRLYAQGMTGVSVDLTLAERYYAKACEGGERDACTEAATLKTSHP